MTWAAENLAWRTKAAENWSAKDSQPLLLRAWLSSPLAWDGWDPLTIEGALQSVVVLRETGRPADDVFSSCPIELPLEDTDIAIPISDRTDLGPVPIARASCGRFSPGAIASLRWRRSRPRAEQYNSPIVRISMAEMKAHNLPSPTMAAAFIEFNVMGDRSRLQSLLQDVTNLGSKRGGGLGQIKTWEVLPAAEDHSIIGPQGDLRRTLPVDAAIQLSGGIQREATLRAPYWHPRTRCSALVPVQKVEA